jgi:hypothetical protein
LADLIITRTTVVAAPDRLEWTSGCRERRLGHGGVGLVVETLLFVSALLGLATAVLNGLVAVRRTGSEKDVLVTMAATNSRLEEGFMNVSVGLKDVTTSLSERLGETHGLMKGMLDELLAKRTP